MTSAACISDYLCDVSGSRLKCFAVSGLFHLSCRGRCVFQVREITFSNAEELTEERLPFLILFHSPDDAETPRRYSKFVEENLRSERGTVMG